MAKKRPKLRPDAAETAYRVMLEATGQAPKTLPPGERTEKDTEAVARGSRGGQRRKANLTPADRSAIARKAAEKRWAKDNGPGE